MAPGSKSREPYASRRPVKREHVVRRACNSCRKMKTKCDGVAPTCGPCRRKGLSCLYAPLKEEVFARTKAANQQLRDELQSARDQIGHLLQQQSSPTATESFMSLQVQDVSSSGGDDDATVRTGAPCSDAILTNQMLWSAGSEPPQHLTRSPGIQDGDTRNVHRSGAHALLDLLTFADDLESSAALARMRWAASWKDEAAACLCSTSTSSWNQQPSSNPTRSPTELFHQPVKLGLSRYIADAEHLYEIAIPDYRFDREDWSRIHSDEPDTSYLAASRHGFCRRPGFAYIANSPDVRFANLTFSAPLTSNPFSPYVQANQSQKIVAAPWQARIINCASPEDPIARIFQSMIKEIRADNEDIETFCGAHPYLEALNSERVFKAAPKLSQVTAKVVKSIKLEEKKPTITQYALMWGYWALWKWMISPSPKTYQDIPEILRPTPAQLSIPHPMVFDFLPFPKLRNAMCQLQRPLFRWLAEAWSSLRCASSVPEFPLFKRQVATGEFGMNPMCKVHVSQTQNWSLGPSVRETFNDIDQFVEVRETD